MTTIDLAGIETIKWIIRIKVIFKNKNFRISIISRRPRRFLGRRFPRRLLRRRRKRFLPSKVKNQRKITSISSEKKINLGGFYAETEAYGRPSINGAKTNDGGTKTDGWTKTNDGGAPENDGGGPPLKRGQGGPPIHDREANANQTA